MKRLHVFLLPMAAAVLFTTGAVLAQQHGPGHGPPHPHGHGHGHGPGHVQPHHDQAHSIEHHAKMLEHLARALGLTGAQRTSLEHKHEKLRAVAQPLVEKQQALHDQVEAALERGADAATVGGLVIAAYRVRLQLKAAHDGLQREIEALLTADQVKKLRELKLRPPAVAD